MVTIYLPDQACETEEKQAPTNRGLEVDFGLA